MKNLGRNILIWGAIFLALILVFNSITEDNSPQQRNEVTASEFLLYADKGKVTRVAITGNKLIGLTSDGQQISAYYPVTDRLVQDLCTKGINVRIVPEEEPSLLFRIIISYLPTLVFITLLIVFYRQMQMGSNKALSFSKSKARLTEQKQNRITFADVAGIDEAKGELEEIVDFLRYPQKFERLGGRIPKGVLLVGAPGNGKTLLAKAVAGEANVPFFSISGSDFVEMFVGVGASRVRDMFEKAKKQSPCILFIDEIDAVGRHRGVGIGGGNDEREQTLNQLLVEMDGFQSNEGIIILAATNRADVLDRALLRPGRFDRQVYVPNPDIVGRTKILSVHTKRIPVDKDVDLLRIARSTPGFSGAQLANLANEAALMAAKANKKSVTMRFFEQAKDKIMLGAERRSQKMQQSDRKNTAYHEAGHAIVAMFVEAGHPIYKATIVPRAEALGMVVRVPEIDPVSVTKIHLLSDIAVAMGGRVAEELILGKNEITSGASSDIQQATRIARKMVMQYGMSEKVGNIDYGEHDEETSKLSDNTIDLINAEIKLIINTASEQAKDILTTHINSLHLLATALLEHETLDLTQIKALLAGEKIELNHVLEEDNNKKPSINLNVPDDDKVVA